MAGIAIVFPGQGAQEPGMGQSLVEYSAAAREVFAQADAIRPGTTEQCFHGTMEELMITINTQPCLWVVEMAAMAALAEAGVKVDATAGFSLGELASLTLAKSADFSTGFQLVCRRAALMDAASKAEDAAMAAVMKLDAKTVDQLCQGFAHVWPVNYNCPGQITVSGRRDELEQFLPEVKAAGGIGKMLKVSGAFHSPLMQSAADQFAKDLQQYTFAPPQIPLYANYSGLPYPDNAEGARELLTKQICNPVHWQTIIENMAAAGIDTFIEAGPGKTLSGFIKRTLTDVRILSVSDADTLKATLEELKAC